MWQDIVFTIGGVLIILFFIPALFDQQKPPLQTSVPNVFILAAFAITQSTLELWTLAIPTAVVTCLWTIVAIQRMKQPKELKIKK